MLRFVLSLVILLIITLLVLSLARIPVDITRYGALIEAQASRALKRPVTVEGPIVLTTSLWPYLELAGLRIAGSLDATETELLHMKRARVTVGLLPLLERELHIRSFLVEGLSLNLVRAADGRVNWTTGRTAGKKAGPVEKSAGVDAPAALTVAVDELSLGDVSLRFEDRAEEELYSFMLYQARGAAPFGEPLSLDMKGTLQEEPYRLSLRATSLAEFIAMTNTRIDIGIDIAGTRLELGGFTDMLGQNLRTELGFSVMGERLDSLNSLLGVDLPPLQDYRMRADLIARPGQLEMADLQIQVGSSTLQGSALVDDTVDPPTVSLDLLSESIQLQDFETPDWSPEPATPESESEPENMDSAKPAAEAAKPAKPLSAESLRRLNARLSLSVEQVLSGEDRFGSGKLQLSLQDGRLSVDPLALESDAQSLLVKVSLKPDRQLSEASLRVLAKQVDLGALLHLSNPETAVGGTLDIDLDVQSEAARFGDLLANANGYFDVSVIPENLQSGLVDLWAVNLLAAVVDSAVKSEDVPIVNCLLSRWSMENGRMKSRQLAVDTTRIRICGDGRVDFAARDIKLSAKPKAKRPEFFSLATPIKIKGSFEDFGIGLKGGALTVGTTALGFIISPITTPLQRLVREDLPADGADICGLPIGPHEEKLEDLPGC
jgi:uncharacterized protein involved in outer membrane biogenesis